MNAESLPVRAGNIILQFTLRTRQPVRRLAGSVRNAVAICSIISAGLFLLLGNIYLWSSWQYRGVSCLVVTSASFAFLTVIANTAIIFGILTKKDDILHYIVCAALALYAVTVPLSSCAFFGAAINGFLMVPLCEIPRIGANLLQLGLLYCLLIELRGDPTPFLEAAETTNNWLKNNLAQSAIQESQKKVHMEDQANKLTPINSITAESVQPSHIKIEMNNSGPKSYSTA